MNKKKKKVKGKTKGKGKANGAAAAGPAPAPKTGPSLNLRLRDQKGIDAVKSAAKRAGLSMNTWVCEVLDKASAAQG